MLIKRDDLNDLTANGNKLRKLEFILPEVLNGGHDWILSFGPLQSNSCRVLSAVAPRLGLRSAHVLVKDASYDEKAPPQGNLFLNKLFGAQLFLVTREEYLEKGQGRLVDEAREILVQTHGARNPFILPMGGNTLPGVFGYIECIRELEEQLSASNTSIDEILFACGSGGTAAGLAIGKYLSSSPFLQNTQLTGYIAWDAKPDYFHDYVNEMLSLVGLAGEVRSEDLLRFVEAKGEGYGINTDSELGLVKDVSESSGIVLDGTYTGKAMRAFIEEGRYEEGNNFLFLHTGGLFSIMGNEKYAHANSMNKLNVN